MDGLWRRALIGVIGAMTAGLLVAPALAENRIALVIGNSNYETVTVLPNPANDAKAMSGLLTAAGFEIVHAPDLTAGALRRTLRDFAGKVAEKGPDTVALVFYAGHGLQVDGENFLVPIDARIQRESDVPMETVRLTDVMNALSSVPSRMRIVILDACRNNPFADIKATTGRGLAIVDAPTGSIVSYATAPGVEALDGAGENSPFTAALVEVAKEPGLPIEQAFKRVRLAVHKTTNGQQTPWESSSLTGDFTFFGGPVPSPAQLATAAPGLPELGGARAQQTKGVQQWRGLLETETPDAAFEIVIREDVVEAYEAYIAIFGASPAAGRVRALLDRRREMFAWYTAVMLNTVASFRSFLERFPDSDLAPTARRLQERARTRSALASINPGGIPVSSDAVPLSAVPPAPPPVPVAAVPPAACTCSEPNRAAPPPSRSTRPPRRETSRRPGGRSPTDDDIFGPGRGPGAGAPPIVVGIPVPVGGRPTGGRPGRYPPPTSRPPVTTPPSRVTTTIPSRVTPSRVTPSRIPSQAPVRVPPPVRIPSGPIVR